MKIYLDPNGGMHYHISKDCPAVKGFYPDRYKSYLLTSKIKKTYIPCPFCVEHKIR